MNLTLSPPDGCISDAYLPEQFSIVIFLLELDTVINSSVTVLVLSIHILAQLMSLDVPAISTAYSPSTPKSTLSSIIPKQRNLTSLVSGRRNKWFPGVPDSIISSPIIVVLPHA